MPKVKIPRKSTSIDMAPMCDVAFLLLSFFMLTTKFRPDEPVVVDTPASISQIKLPEKDILQITIDKDNRVFFGIDGQESRKDMLAKMGEKYKVQFTAKQAQTFSLVSTFGVPVAQLPQFLDLGTTEREKIKQPGIPTDSTNNQLGDWILFARQAGVAHKQNYRFAVKGDREAGYPTAKRVFDILQERKINTFNFITSMKADPGVK